MKTDTYTPTKIETWPVQYEAVKVWRETKKRQCFGRLRQANPDAACAIGVLGGFDYIGDFGIGLEGPCGECPKCGYEFCCAAHLVVHWNDNHEFTFKEIADLAEANPHLVFTEAQS